MADLSIIEVERQFIDAMRDAGLTTHDTIAADGTLHRFYVEGDKRGSRNGWYVLHADGVPAGVFGYWSSGLTKTWRADMGRRLTAAEERSHRERMEAIQRQRNAQRQEEQAAAADRAAGIWGLATTPAPDHPYLVAKAVRAFGIRQHGDSLLVPLGDSKGTLHGLQTIAPDGSKKFGSGTAKAGHYHSIGATPAGVLAVVEGIMMRCSSSLLRTPRR